MEPEQLEGEEGWFAEGATSLKSKKVAEMDSKGV